MGLIFALGDRVSRDGIVSFWRCVLNWVISQQSVCAIIHNQATSGASPLRVPPTPLRQPSRQLTARFRRPQIRSKLTIFGVSKDQSLQIKNKHNNIQWLHAPSPGQLFHVLSDRLRCADNQRRSAKVSVQTHSYCCFIILLIWYYDTYFNFVPFSFFSVSHWFGLVKRNERSWRNERIRPSSPPSKINFRLSNSGSTSRTQSSTSFDVQFDTTNTRSADRFAFQFDMTSKAPVTTTTGSGHTLALITSWITTLVVLASW